VTASLARFDTDDKLGPGDGMELGLILRDGLALGSDEGIYKADGRELRSSEGLMLPLGLELGPVDGTIEQKDLPAKKTSWSTKAVYSLSTGRGGLLSPTY
jgi:hypothetical protein